MIAPPPATSAELRDNLISVLGDQLGSYSRPNAPDVPAAWVGNTIPRGYKVKVAKPVEPVISAIELVIDRFPDYRLQARNTVSKGIAESWRVFLVFHDERQDPRLAVNSIMRSFNVVQFERLPATDLNPEQCMFRIEYYNRLRED